MADDRLPELNMMLRVEGEWAKTAYFVGLYGIMNPPTCSDSSPPLYWYVLSGIYAATSLAAAVFGFYMLHMAAPPPPAAAPVLTWDKLKIVMLSLVFVSLTVYACDGHRVVS